MMRICHLCKSDLRQDNASKAIVMIYLEAGHKTHREIPQGMSQQAADQIFDRENNLVNRRITILYGKVCKDCESTAEEINRVHGMRMIDIADVPPGEDPYEYWRQIARGAR